MSIFIPLRAIHLDAKVNNCYSIYRAGKPSTLFCGSSTGPIRYALTRNVFRKRTSRKLFPTITYHLALECEIALVAALATCSRGWDS